MIGAPGNAPHPDSQASAPPPDEPAPPSSDTPLLRRCVDRRDPARASGGPRRNRAGLRQGLQLRQHPQSLCLRLAPLHGLGASAWPARPAPGSPGHRALHRRLRLGGRRPQTLLGAHDRAPAFGADVEFRPARREIRPLRPPCRHRPRRRPPHPRPAARAEGGGAARGPPGDARDAGSRRPHAACATGRSCCSASPAACGARKSSASTAAPRTASTAAGPNSSTTACC